MTTPTPSHLLTVLTPDQTGIIAGITALLDELEVRLLALSQGPLTRDSAMAVLAEAVAAKLIEMSDGFAGLIVTTGGTGFAPVAAAAPQWTGFRTPDHHQNTSTTSSRHADDIRGNLISHHYLNSASC